MKFFCHLAAIACLLSGVGQSWAAGPGTKPDCNNNIVLTEIQPLKFGSFDSSTAGTVTVDPVTGQRSATGVNLAGNDGQPGIYEISMAPGYSSDCSIYQVIITLPSTYTLSNGVATMTVGSLTSSPASDVGTLGPGNTPLLVYIGGTATVAAGQPGGLYTGSYSISMVFR